jgi:hypothetical protein
VVTQASATIHRHGVRDISLDCNHSQMNKFRSKENPDYVKIVQELRRMVHQTLFERAREYLFPGCLYFILIAFHVATPEEEEILKSIKPKDLDSDCPHKPCLQETRQDILAHINEWVADLDAPNVLWIKGYPGVGKSAIASTLASTLQGSGRLGSSFFFQRAKAASMTTRVLWRKVAVDLARRYPPTRRVLVDKMRTDEVDLSLLPVRALFDILIREPLAASEHIPNNKLPVIVVDALDECGGLKGAYSEDRMVLIQTLKLWAGMPKNFKLIVTSRDESDIGDSFLEIDHYSIELFAGHRVTKTSSNDIRLFLQDRFSSISARWRSLPVEWPEPGIIDDLTTKAEGLFIWAKTVIEFIGEGNPKNKLNQILGRRAVNGIKGLYSHVLDISFGDPDEETIRAFRSIVGTVILAKKPLSASSVRQLLSIDETMFEHICKGLRSVLDSKEFLKFNHQSFVDFLLDDTASSSKFLIKTEDGNQELVLSCLQTMKKELRFNICELESSHVRNRDIPDLDIRIQNCISQHLSYSCYYWMDHLAKTRGDDRILNMLRAFTYDLFLYWLEVLSVSGSIDLARGMMGSLTKWMKVRLGMVLVLCVYQN